TGYYLGAKLADCLARNAQRTGKDRVPEVGLFATAKALVRPALAEGFDLLYYVTFGADGEFVVSDWVEEAGDG
ncbi:MAG TPA: ATP-binding protein, partial [Gemmataceae bacterium]|nr:ATP-binding protein [Gemmataceae bacterium]